uniref:AlNc14C233G9328 protein n=1 Tax=Albugo laibachii Nc14 TaxID=890382 RepID=F0WSI5_9STRA|nr:AlNc14C233G9328 [Albugo laibachii Nc14]|eukprot:CCA24309.1 AlNc14C233G9328 [Albugo laibachii Nc14]
MEDFDEQEPQAYITFLIAALRPADKFSGVRGLDQAPSDIVYTLRKKQSLTMAAKEKIEGVNEIHMMHVSGANRGNNFRRGPQVKQAPSKGYSHTKSEKKTAQGSDRQRDCL